MKVLGVLIVVVCIVWCMVMTVWVIYGAVCAVRHDKKREAVMLVDGTTGNPMAEVGISVIACGCRGFVDVVERLSADYLFYEVIIVCDTYRTDGGRDILDHYSMVRVEADMGIEVCCGQVRAVYRSKERRYHRLVVVDYYGESEEEMYNCGLAVASYDYVIPVGRDVLLRSDALIMFNSALHDMDGGGMERRGAVVVGYSERVSSQTPFGVIRDAVSNVRVSVPLGRMIYGYRYVTMWRGDEVMALGGFVVRGGEAVSRGANLTHRIGMAGAVAEDEGRLMVRDVVWQRVAVRLFWCVWGLVAVWAIVERDMVVGEWLKWMLLMAYVTVMTTGSVALSIEVGRGYVSEQLRHRSLLAMLLYPLREFIWLWMPRRY